MKVIEIWKTAKGMSNKATKGAKLFRLSLPLWIFPPDKYNNHGMQLHGIKFTLMGQGQECYPHVEAEAGNLFLFKCSWNLSGSNYYICAANNSSLAMKMLADRLDCDSIELVKYSIMIDDMEPKVIHL